MERLAEFVGRLYLLLIVIVFDHPRWLPRGLRAQYRAALDEIYPAVYAVQSLLYNGGRDDPRGAAELARLLGTVGLSGRQLDLKLEAYLRAEARFYGAASPAMPDRRFPGREPLRLPPADVSSGAIEANTEGDKKFRMRMLVEPAAALANIVCGSLFGGILLADVLQEAKDGIEQAIKNAGLVKKAGLAAASGVMWVVHKVPTPRRRRHDEPTPA